MIPFVIDQIVHLNGQVYYVDQVVEDEQGLYYWLRQTADRHLPSSRTKAKHEDLEARGVLVRYVLQQLSFNDQLWRDDDEQVD